MCTRSPFGIIVCFNDFADGISYRLRSNDFAPHLPIGKVLCGLIGWGDRGLVLSFKEAHIGLLAFIKRTRLVWFSSTASFVLRQSLPSPRQKPPKVEASPLTRELLMLQALWLQSVRAQTAFFVFFVVFKVAFKPLHMRIAFKGQNVGTDPVKEETIV